MVVNFKNEAEYKHCDTFRVRIKTIMANVNEHQRKQNIDFDDYMQKELHRAYSIYRQFTDEFGRNKIEDDIHSAMLSVKTAFEE